jgi:predicted transcriptional regulator
VSDYVRRGSRRNFFIVDNGIFDEGLQIDALDKLVYICLLRYADNNTREAFPGQQRIAEDCGLARKRVNKAIRTLEEVGLIEKQARYDKTGGQKSNLYIVYDANEVINRVCLTDTGGVSHGHRGCVSRTQEGVSHGHTKKTYLEILREEETFSSLKTKKEDQKVDFSILKSLVN